MDSTDQIRLWRQVSLARFRAGPILRPKPFASAHGAFPVATRWIHWWCTASSPTWSWNGWSGRPRAGSAKPVDEETRKDHERIVEHVKTLRRRVATFN